MTARKHTRYVDSEVRVDLQMGAGRPGVGAFLRFLIL
jgi:hypothetical protein